MFQVKSGYITAVLWLYSLEVITSISVSDYSLHSKDMGRAIRILTYAPCIFSVLDTQTCIGINTRTVSHVSQVMLLHLRVLTRKRVKLENAC